MKLSTTLFAAVALATSACSNTSNVVHKTAKSVTANLSFHDQRNLVLTESCLEACTEGPEPAADLPPAMRATFKKLTTKGPKLPVYREGHQFTTSY